MKAEDILKEAKNTVARKYGFEDWWSLDFNKTNLSQEALRDEAALLAMSKVAEPTWNAAVKFCVMIGNDAETTCPDKSTYMNNIFPKKI